MLAVLASKEAIIRVRCCQVIFDFHSYGNLMQCFVDAEAVPLMSPLKDPVSLAVESNFVISQGRSSLAVKERESGPLHLQLLLGPSWVSYKTARLLKSINGMAQSAPMYHCSATLFITSRANSVNRFLFFLPRKQRFGEGWMISTCCDFCVLC